MLVMVLPMGDAQQRVAGAYKRIQGLLKEAAVETDDSKRRHKGGGVSRRTGAVSVGDAVHADAGHRLGGGLIEVARFLSLIGRDEAAMILKRLSESESERVLEAMAHLGPVSRREAVQVLTRFGAAERARRMGRLPGETRVGPETAREILGRAFGPEEGDRRFYEILPDERPHRFAFLEDTDGRQLSFLLKKESAPAIAIMCANMPRGAAARLLEALEEEKKAAVVRRMAEMGPVSPDVLEAIEKTLQRRMESIQRPEGEELDGQGRLAEILRYMDLNSSDRILQGIGLVSTELAERIRKQLNSPEDILYIPDRDLQKVLKRLDDVDLATLMKGKNDEIIRRLQSGVSQRRWEMVVLHRENLGPMRKSDVDRVTSDFMKLIREMALAGEIAVMLPGEDEWVR
ncbi:MAG: FliG C-terminal domain-containing protein [Alkalispirochaeta sp.]